MSDYDHSNFILESQQKELKVNAIKVQGIVHTNHEFLTQITKPLLEAKTLQEVIVGSRIIADKMNRLGIFKTVGITLDANPVSPSDTVDVIYKVAETSRIFARTGADFGAYEGSMNVSMSIRNTFGNAETITGTSSYGIDTATPLNQRNQKEQIDTGMQGASAHQLTFSKPLYGNPDMNMELSAFKLDRDHTLFKSYNETLRGITCKIKSILNNTGIYEMGYNAVWRENHSLNSNASLSVRSDAGHSLKSSVSHSLSLDSRNDSVFPSKGTYFKLQQEFAGLGGDIQFFKNEVESYAAAKLPFKLAFNASFRGGVILPWSFDGTGRTRINDRFSFGGPTSIRGFQQGGIGPKDKSTQFAIDLDDAIGGDAYCGVGASVMFPLPVVPSDLFRGHVFANSGSLVPLKTDSFNTNIRHLIMNPSVSTGIGLVARFTNFRLELNYCVPLRIATTDTLKPGLQLGIGMNFM